MRVYIHTLNCCDLVYTVLTARRTHPTVINAVYDGIGEDHYEHLPDCRGRPPPSLPLHQDHPLTTTPQLPPPKGTSISHPTPDKPTSKLRRVSLPESKSLSGVSCQSSEDCYTVMNSGTVTILPRVTTSAAAAAWACGGERKSPQSTREENKCGDDDDDISM